jgi:hypothetical protein
MQALPEPAAPARASMTVRGMVGSSMVVTTSRKGTPMTTAQNRSGRMLVTAPMVSPPAERPWARARLSRRGASGRAALGSGPDAEGACNGEHMQQCTAAGVFLAT